MAEPAQVRGGKLAPNPGDFLRPAGLDHAGHPRLDPPIELGQRYIEPDDDRRPGWRIGLARHTGGTAGDRVDLERTNYPTRISLRQLGAGGIDSPKLGSEGLGTFELEALFERRP